MALGINLKDGNRDEIDLIASQPEYAFITEFETLDDIREKVREVLCDLVSYRWIY